MLLLHNPHLLPTLLLAWLAISPCWAPPPPNEPSTPQPKLGPPGHSRPTTPGAPLQPGRSASFNMGEHLIKWIEEQDHGKWIMAANTKGGVEGWVQFEFEYYLKQLKGRKPEDIFREEHVYEQASLAADWVLRPNFAGGTISTKGLIAELKVESQMRMGKKFSAAVEADKKKLEGPLQDKYKGYSKMFYAIAWNPETQAALKEIGLTPNSGLNRHVDKNQYLRLYEWTPDNQGRDNEDKEGITKAIGDLSLGGSSLDSGGQSSRGDQQTPSKGPRPAGRKGGKGGKTGA